MHRRLTAATAPILLAFSPAAAFAHPVETLAPANLWTSWTWEPGVVLTLLVAAILYAVGVWRLWSISVGVGIKRWEASAFAAGWSATAMALVSPLHALGGSLFSAHMAQHELLISVSAPLLVLGRPLIPFLWALPRSWRPRIGGVALRAPVSSSWRVLSRPSVAFTLHAIALWAWHLPGPYQATLTSELMHTLQHLSFIATALLFWWTIFGARHSTLGYGGAVFYLFATALQTGALGALLTFAPTLWYPVYASTTAAWGLNPLEDQQLGGLIMWIPGSIPYLVAAMVVFMRWLKQSEARSARHYGSLAGVRTMALLIVALALSSCDRASGDDRYQLTNADPDRGRIAIRHYGCGSCHDIPGITGAGGMVGPPLGKISQRVFIAGVLPNDPDNMIRWIENPPGVDPKTAMPNLGVSVRDARDIAAYLYTLR
ncbi:MAG TPA: cytochrome c oxidase assembly protein [Gemmatimonadaceae bacterium]